MISIRGVFRRVFIAVCVAGVANSSFANDELIEQLETLLTERSNPEASARFSFVLDGCILTRSILHDKDRVCSQGKGGWYRNDQIIDLRSLSTSPSTVRIRASKYNWEQIQWQFRNGLAASDRAYLQKWHDRHMTILRKDMALPEYDLVRRMNKLRMLIDEMFPLRNFFGHSERVEYCEGAGTLHAPPQLWVIGDVRVAHLPLGSSEQVVDLIHRYAQRHCTPN